MKIIILIFLYMLLGGCSLFNSNEAKKSIRDFTWSADTLWNYEAFQVLMKEIWGSAANDLYIVGHTADNDHTIYHFDGRNWKVPPYNNRHGGYLTGGFNFDDIWGTSKSDVWAVGQGGEYKASYRVIHYGGYVWKDIPVESKDVYDPGFACVWGRARDDVWFTDYRGHVFHYDGSTIKRDMSKVDLVYNESDIYESYIGGDGDGNVYFNLIKMDENDSTNTFSHVFKLSNGEWKEIYRNWVFNYGPYIVNFWTGPQGVLYGTGGGLNILVNDVWEQIYSRDINDVSGPAADDLLIVRGSGEAYHYNGTEWQEIEVLNHHEINYRFCWYDGKEAFVGGWNNEATIILHGK